MNVNQFIKDNIEQFYTGTHHDHDRLLRNIFRNKFEAETGYYVDSWKLQDYEVEKKEKLKKIKEAGITPELYKKFHSIPYHLRQRFLLLKENKLDISKNIADDVINHFNLDTKKITVYTNIIKIKKDYLNEVKKKISEHNALINTVIKIYSI